MTADFGNFVAKTDEKQKSKDEMNPEIVSTFSSPKDSKSIYSRCVVQNYRLLSRYADKLEVRIIMIKNRCL